MALFHRSHLFGLLLLASMPLDGAAALALAAAQAPAPPLALAAAQAPAPPSIEDRLSRIAAAVQEQGGEVVGEDAGAVPEDALSYVFVNGSGLGWGNGGFRNGGFYNGGFYNGGFRNGGFYNGGFRNGGFRNGGFYNGGRYWR